jgi:hypothetical protein
MVLVQPFEGVMSSRRLNTALPRLLDIDGIAMQRGRRRGRQALQEERGAERG